MKYPPPPYVLYSAYVGNPQASSEEVYSHADDVSEVDFSATGQGKWAQSLQ
ncbi:hypothetical protein DPMN_024191 [Dreissena polymorpha]|uniref:Uncharacterized protein n=1 Tax=Dreissena polymorpha TaxID=45954 RepID=A0A9D4LP34_DREPO|nr:hypothetical protein DPMN_024191 [Dreissena polymorpha]